MHYWFKIYSDIDGGVNFAFWWRYIRIGLCLEFKFLMPPKTYVFAAELQIDQSPPTPLYRVPFNPLKYKYDVFMVLEVIFLGLLFWSM